MEVGWSVHVKASSMGVEWSVHVKASTMEVRWIYIHLYTVHTCTNTHTLIHRHSYTQYLHACTLFYLCRCCSSGVPSRETYM